MVGARRVVWALAMAAGSLAIAAVAFAADPPTSSERLLRFYFQPAARAQIALWVERPDGTFVDTIRLTQSVSYRGIGNRPGATQMNSGFRWPYGRREGALPVWAHRRAAAPGAELFPRVIFQDRTSEGWASRSSPDFSRDDWFCLSFNAATTRRDALDAVSCASVFNSDKGRYLTEADVSGGYSEPWEDADGSARMRRLPLGSLYPPRRDVGRCTATGCNDHPDVDRFAADAREVMPGLDAVTMATPPGDTLQRIQYRVPTSWPPGDYVAFLEINVEGDYNDTYNDSTHPTPTEPEGAWDYWAINYGYAYRGQPSVIYRVHFTLTGAGTYESDDPAGWGELEGESGVMSPMSAGNITDAPATAPGSGADRLEHMSGDARFRVEVIATNLCAGPSPPAECGAECSQLDPCAEGFLCGPDDTCVGRCEISMPPQPVESLVAETHPDEKLSHRVALLRFVVPESVRTIAEYEVKVDTSPIVDEGTFLEAMPALGPSIDSIALVVPTDGAPGDVVEVEVGGLSPETRYWIAARPKDDCYEAAPLAVTEITTTEIHFTTVSPCFVATAAWGSPMADDVATLRRFRDRHLMSHAPGRAAVGVYYAVGPLAASLIRGSDTLRAVARSAITPWVFLAELLE